MAQLVSSFFNVSSSFVEEKPIDAIRIIKHFAFDWPNHFGYLSATGQKVQAVFENAADLTDFYDFFKSTHLFLRQRDLLRSFFEANAIEVICGDKELYNEAIGLLSDALSLYGTLTGVKFFTIASTLGAIMRNLQEIYQNWNCSDKNLTLTKETASLIKNLLSLSESVLEEALKQTLILSCGSIVCAVKITQFVLDKIQQNQRRNI